MIFKNQEDETVLMTEQAVRGPSVHVPAGEIPRIGMPETTQAERKLVKVTLGTIVNIPENEQKPAYLLTQKRSSCN